MRPCDLLPEISERQAPGAADGALQNDFLAFHDGQGFSGLRGKNPDGGIVGGRNDRVVGLIARWWLVGMKAEDITAGEPAAEQRTQIA